MDKTKDRSWILVLVCWFAYVSSYVGRLSYSANIQNFIVDYGITKTETGQVSSAFFFCYGAGQFINAMLCEKCNSRWLIPAALSSSALITFLFGVTSHTVLHTILWAVNGLLLSTLWSNIMKEVGRNVSAAFSGKAIVWLATAATTGTFISYGLSAFCTFLGSWQVIFLLSPLFLLAGAVAFYFGYTFFLKHNENRADDEEIVSAHRNERSSLLKTLSYVCFPLFFLSCSTNFIREGINTWLPSFLNEMFDLPVYTSILLTLFLPIFCIFATVIANLMSKKLKNDLLVAGLFHLLSGMSFAVLIYTVSRSLILSMLAFLLAQMFSASVNDLITSIFPVHMRKYLGSGKTAGILNCCAYLGNTVSTVILGHTVDMYGWNRFLIILLCVALCSALVGLIGARLLKKRIRELSVK